MTDSPYFSTWRPTFYVFYVFYPKDQAIRFFDLMEDMPPSRSDPVTQLQKGHMVKLVAWPLLTDHYSRAMKGYGQVGGLTTN